MDRKKLWLRLAVLAAAAAVLAAAFFLGDSGPTAPPAPSATPTAALTQRPEPSEAPASSPALTPSPAVTPTPEESGEAPSPTPTAVPTPSPTLPPAAQPTPSAEEEPDALTCTLSISCATVLDNLADLEEDKIDLIPADGWVLPPTEVEWEEGESAFSLLQRVCREEGIHLEFSSTPLYNSAYIEGIGNLYEFDCGPLSGWTYRVNGQFPGFGCSQYLLESGDTVEFLYTCDLGDDVGGYAGVG